MVRRLEEADVVENFDCNDPALNSYVKKHAWSNQQKSFIGVTYVVVDEAAPQTVLGYFTLATSSIPRDAFPKKHVRGLPTYDLPLILLARLAVDHRFERKGLGTLLLKEAFKISLNIAERVGWYAKYGFVSLEESAENKPTRRMFLDIRTLRLAATCGAQD